jgi:hypothetical protein
MNIKKEIENLSTIKNIDEKIKKIVLIKQEIDKNKNLLKKLIDNNTQSVNTQSVNTQSVNTQSVNTQSVNTQSFSLDELKNKFYETQNINEKNNYYQLFASKILLLENELYEEH